MKKRMNRILNVPVKKNKWRLLIGLYFMIGVSVFLVGCGEGSNDKKVIAQQKKMSSNY